ncbi:unnamed protein product [Auanema sp. JU1783]|nr:unnamed protein product [Auanema sp. JU1783]
MGERCVGCGSDSTIRVHYGAPSCHGCKAFFRRSVFEGRVYVCSADNLCSITNESRNRCRACRLRNCLEGGMNPKHVREERTKVEKLLPGMANEPSSESNNSKPSSGSNDECQFTIFLCGLEHQTERLVDEDCSTGSGSGEWSRHVSLTLGIQNPQLVIHRTRLNWRAFVLHADWALGIPDFRVIPLEDQTQLFKQNFMAFGWITYSYKCYENNSEDVGVPMGNGSYLPYNRDEIKLMEAKWISVYGPVSQKLVEMTVKPMKEMQMSFEEYCLLKAITLFQQNCPLSTTAQTICKKVSDRLLEALARSIAKHYPHLTAIQQSSRAMKILLLISCFNHVGTFESSMILSLAAADRAELSGVPMELMRSHTSSAFTDLPPSS